MMNSGIVRLAFSLLVAVLTGTPVAAFAQTDAEVDTVAYRIGKEDVLHVRVWGHPDLTTIGTVSETGRVQLPLVGSVRADGLTTRELGAELSRQFSLIDPTMTDVIVTVTEFHSQRVMVVGEVHTPGTIGFREIPDLWTVIHGAGGATPDADLARVQIVRRDREADEPFTVVVDLSRGPENTPPESLPTLHPRDTVVVPALTEGVPSGDTFQVIGAVRTPGVYRISTAETVVKAVAVSGGPLGNADLRGVRLTRPNHHGAVAYELDLRTYLYDGSPAADLRLRAGDTITVPEKGATLGGVWRTLLQVVPLATAVVSLGIALN